MHRKPCRKWFFTRRCGGADRPDPRKKVGKLLAKGDCDGAKNAALESGDKRAKEVVEFCARQ
jgi:hypothetical protein